MYDPKVEEFLAHHGVRGMKWGVRKGDGDSNDRGEGGGGDDLVDELSLQELIDMGIPPVEAALLMLKSPSDRQKAVAKKGPLFAAKLFVRDMVSSLVPKKKAPTLGEFIAKKLDKRSPAEKFMDSVFKKEPPTLGEFVAKKLDKRSTMEKFWDEALGL